MNDLLRTPTIQAAAFTFSLLIAASAHGQLPAARLHCVFPAGGQQGQSFEATAAGSDLDDLTQLVFSHPGITATRKTKPQSSFTVAVADDVPIGLYEARVIGRFGISNPRAFTVGQWPESVEIEPNQPEADGFAEVLERANEVTVGSTVNGIASGGIDIDYFKFPARRGDRLLIDCWAHRIDSRLDGTLAVFDAKGRRLATSRDVNRRDPLIDFDVPADGTYVVAVWDFVYGGSGRDGAARPTKDDYFYRLSIGTAPYIDYVFPPSGQSGASGRFTLYGRNLPGGSPTELKLDGRPLEKLVVEINIPSGPATRQLQFNSLVESDDASLDGFEYRLAGPSGPSNPMMIGFATAPLVEEQEPNDTPQQAQRLTLPCEYAGRFQKGDDQDWISLEAKKGDVYMLEVIARRQRSPCDTLMVIQQVTIGKDGSESVKDLQKLDDLTVNLGGYLFDTRSDDPLYRFVAPEDGLYRIVMSDLSSSGDPRCVYRLSLRREMPDFRLVAVPISRNRQEKKVLMGVPLLRRGGTAAIHLLAYRRDGFAEEIHLSVKGLPPGVTCPETVIGPSATSATLVFRAAEDAPAWAGRIQVVGKAKVGDVEIKHEARGGSVIWNDEVQNNEAADARLTRDIALAVSGFEQAPFAVAVADEQVHEISRPGKLEIPLQATRRGDFKGLIALEAVGVPKDIRINNASFAAGKEEATLILEVLPGASLGTYSFSFNASGEVSYRHPNSSKSNNLVDVEPVLPITLRIAPGSSGKGK